MSERKRGVAVVGWVVAIAMGAYAFAWLALPPLIKWQGKRVLTSTLGRAVSIGHVAFTPYNLGLTLNDISVAGESAGVRTDGRSAADRSAPPLLTVSTLHVDFSVATLWRLAPVIEALEIDGVRLQIARTSAGHYDIDDIQRRLTPGPDQTTGTPVRFALYNLQLRDAAVRFDDRPTGRIHELQSLHLSLPFLSNLPADVDIRVEPHLSFLLNRVAFDSGAFATPFAATRSGDLKLSVRELDLGPYLGYLPDALPVRVKSGTLSTDIDVHFTLPPGKAPALTLRGTASALGVALTDRSGAPFLAWRRLDLGVREASPLARVLEFSTLQIEGAQLDIRRNGAGDINLTSLTAVKPTVAAASEPRAAATGPGSSASNAAVPPAQLPWRGGLERLELTDATVRWEDARLQPGMAMRLNSVSLALSRMRWPASDPMDLTAKGSLLSSARPEQSSGSFSISGTVAPQAAQLDVSIHDLALDALRPYLATVLQPRMVGTATANAHVDWVSAAATPRLRVSVHTARLDDVSMRDAPADPVRPVPPGEAFEPELASLKQLTLDDVLVDVLAREITARRVALDQPALTLHREANGTLNLERWAVRSGAAPASASASASMAASAAPPWRVQIEETALGGGRLQFSDAGAAGASAERPLRLTVSNLRMATQRIAWQGSLPTVPAQIELSGRIGPPQSAADAARTTHGSFDWRGVVGTSPLLAIGSLHAERFELQRLLPYAGNELALRIQRAELGYAGNVSVKQLPTGLDVDAAGDVLIGGVRVDGVSERGRSAPPETLLSWDALAFKSARFSMKPGKRPQLDISQASLSDFYSRLVITEAGRLNLRDLTAVSPQATQAAPPSPTASAALLQQTAKEPVADPTPLPLDVRLGGATLTHGRIDFSDHFVKPNYSAALTELTGQLGALDSTTRDLAPLSLSGKAAGTALLEVRGRVNPVARPLALELHAKATDLELAPLSTYAAKYAGYAIERGKLSMEVDYRIAPDGRLEAKNQVVLNQLTFGEKVESTTATRLPVRLAVALLKDRNGVIDLNLPISGSLNDPQFSVAGIIGRLLVNLVAKAITSPFSLLSAGAAGGDGTTLSEVAFFPGTAELTPGGLESVGKVALSLAEKPGLTLTVTGTADPKTEVDAFRTAALDARLQAARRKAAALDGAAVAELSKTLDPQVRTRLVQQVYEDDDLPNKPRNALGFAKRIPATEMESLLKEAVSVTPDDMRDLAIRRGVAVRDALIAKGLTSARLFLAAPVLQPAAPEVAVRYLPRAELSLSVD